MTVTGRFTRGLRRSTDGRGRRQKFGVADQHERLVEAGALPDKVRIIPPGIDTKRFHAPPMHRKPGDAVELLAAGFLLKRKAFDVIMRAVSVLVTSGYNIRLTIVGDGPQRHALQQLKTELHLDSRVELMGSVPNSQMSDHYNKADIFVNMSTAEGFSVVCLEAMASGLAIVASPAGGFADAIHSGVNGCLVTTNDHHDLAAKIGDLIDDQAKMLRFGYKAREDAIAKFDWNGAIIPRYLEVYEELVRVH